jgi:hypothetical protein
MWKCPKCGRLFAKEGQSHSCAVVPVADHFKHKDAAQALFDYLLARLNQEVGQSQVISLPCCIHLFGTYDWLAILPKKDGLEIRFGLPRALKSPKLIQVVKTSTHAYKNCLKLKSEADLDGEMIGWLTEAFRAQA